MHSVLSIRTFLIALLVLSTQADADNLQPSAEYRPDEVIQIVLDALQQNDDEDSGIATVFRFASPGNRANTGPLERFTGMIKRGFPDMLNHIGSRTGDIVIEGDTAMQNVWLTTPAGTEVGYLFQVGRQPSGEFEGVWMTEAVYPLPGKSQSI